MKSFFVIVMFSVTPFYVSAQIFNKNELWFPLEVANVSANEELEYSDSSGENNISYFAVYSLSESTVRNFIINHRKRIEPEDVNLELIWHRTPIDLSIFKISDSCLTKNCYWRKSEEYLNQVKKTSLEKGQYYMFMKSGDKKNPYIMLYIFNKFKKRLFVFEFSRKFKY